MVWNSYHQQTTFGQLAIGRGFMLAGERFQKMSATSACLHAYANGSNSLNEESTTREIGPDVPVLGYSGRKGRKDARLPHENY